jgi:hypothetical protein
VEWFLDLFSDGAPSTLADVLPVQPDAPPNTEATPTAQANIEENEIDRLAVEDGWNPEQAEIDGIATMDTHRNASDRKHRRGYDYDPTAPGHAEYVYERAQPLARDAEEARVDLSDYINEHAPELLIEDVCRVCRGVCRWCNTPGILRCGACYPDPRRQKRKTHNVKLELLTEPDQKDIGEEQ